jgi:hypothetical protein
VSWYLCQLCGGQAQWPRTKTHVFRFPFGVSFKVAWQTPLVCTTCRMMRQDEVVKLGAGRRRFWKNAVALWLGESYPSMGPKMFKLLTLRLYIGHWWGRIRA